MAVGLIGTDLQSRADQMTVVNILLLIIFKEGNRRAVDSWWEGLVCLCTAGSHRGGDIQTF
jgi:hypothetical protein